MNKVKLSLIVLVCISAQVFAGNLEPPGPPGSSNSAMYTIEAVYQRLDNGTPGTKWTGGFREPTAPPGSTMHNLNEVMAKAPSNVVDAATTNDVLLNKTFWGLTSNEWGTQTGAIPTCTLSAGTNTVEAGYYTVTNLSEVDPDLDSTNIWLDVTIFGVTGAIYHGSAPRTGYTNSYRDGDDGYYTKGVAWPVPRFTVESNTNCVTDNFTGLMWARNAHLLGIVTNWYYSIDYCTNLTYGGYSDWRLSNINELLSLIDFSQQPPQPAGNPFNNIQMWNKEYWSSTTYRPFTNQAWIIEMGFGSTGREDKSGADDHQVWPVRGP